MLRKPADSSGTAARENVGDVQRSHGDGPALEETVLSVPAMTCRHCVRAISAQVLDVAGVVAIEADLTSSTVRVRGSAPTGALVSAITDAGYEAVEVSRLAGREPSPRTTGGSLP